MSRPAKSLARARRPPPRRPPGPKRLANEARSLKAAEEVFATAGFAGARTAAIAKRAGVPKANLHYYFGTKEALYRRLLENLLAVWLGMGDSIRPEADPAQAFAAYIAAKVEHSRRRPYASKVFANELLHGAPQLRQRVPDRAEILRLSLRTLTQAFGQYFLDARRAPSAIALSLA